MLRTQLNAATGLPKQASVHSGFCTRGNPVLSAISSLWRCFGESGMAAGLAPFLAPVQPFPGVNCITLIAGIPRLAVVFRRDLAASQPNEMAARRFLAESA
jgi:hypothetical protein